MSLWRSLVFILVASGLLALAHVYVYRRLVRDTTRSAKLRRAGIAGAVMVMVVFVFTRLLLFKAPAPWFVPLSALLWLWIGFATYLLLSLGSADAVRAIRHLLGRMKRRSEARADPVSEERRLFVSRAVAGGALVVSGGLTSYGFWRAFEPAEISEISIRLPNLPRALDGLTIVQLTDIHISSLIRRKFMEELVHRCNALKPDLVAITGDLVDGTVDALGEAVATLRDLKSRYGTYFVTGNHDYYSGDKQWAAALTRMDMNVLRNRYVRIGDAGASLDLVGVDDWGARTRGGGGGYDLERAIAGRDPSRAAVLLAHEPANFETAALKGMGLQLSGHTHGGQLFPGTVLVRLRWPYCAGLYSHGPGKLYVSRGVGFWGPPLRVGSAPEIVKVTLLA